MVFEREHRSGSRRVRVAVLAVALVVLVAVGVIVGAVGAPWARQRDLPVTGATLDTDGDGLPDRYEISGWQTQFGATHHTDPSRADSDGDGMSDGDEAGPASLDAHGAATYAGRSDPTKADSDDDGLSDAVETGDLSADGARMLAFVVSDPITADSDHDGIGDGDEYFLDMDPLAADTDDDDLVDAVELDFGSDPTLANADDDQYGDAEEYEQGSDPLSYDLTTVERIAAGAAGAQYGDCIDCALDAGLRLEQIETFEYLAGQFASGTAIVGDVRDVGVNLWNGNFLSAGISAVALLPGAGDVTKAITSLNDFARRGERAAQAVQDVVAKLPLPGWAKSRVLGALPSRLGGLPRELAGGPANYVVYAGDNYIGITNDLTRRVAEHSRAGRTFTPVPIRGASDLTRGEARAVEQACIEMGGLVTQGGQLQNRINSISREHDFHADAVAYGMGLLRRIGGSCPITATG